MCLLCPKTSSNPRRLARSFSANNKLEPERTRGPETSLSPEHWPWEPTRQPLLRIHILHLHKALWRREVGSVSWNAWVEKKKACRLTQYWPAVEGGVGDDGDVRGELAPDPAEKNREILMGTKNRHLKLGMSRNSALFENLLLAQYVLWSNVMRNRKHRN